MCIISLIIIAYFVYQNRQLKTSKTNTSNKNKERDNSNDMYDDVRGNEQSTFTALQRSGKDETDDHVYEVPHDYVNQMEVVF